MRILLAAKTMGVGGLERIVVGLARELQSRGHAVWVVSSGGDLVDELKRAGTTHVAAPLEITSPIGVAQAARQIRRLILEQCEDGHGCAVNDRLQRLTCHRPRLPLDPPRIARLADTVADDAVPLAGFSARHAVGKPRGSSYSADRRA